METVRLTETGAVSEQEEFFQDHFPDFPVLPGVLMLEILKRAAEKYFDKAGGKKFRLTEIRNVKYSRFLRPGDPWESSLELLDGNENASEWKGRLLTDGRPVCTAEFKLQ